MANPNTAVFPGAVATDTDLPVATNSFSTTLNGSITSSATSLTLTSASGLNVPCVLKIDSEYILATSLSTNTLSGCTRGLYGSTGASHSSGATVTAPIVASHVNQLAAEVKAIETAVSGLGGFSLSPLVFRVAEDWFNVANPESSWSGFSSTDGSITWSDGETEGRPGLVLLNSGNAGLTSQGSSNVGGARTVPSLEAGTFDMYCYFKTPAVLTNCTFKVGTDQLSLRYDPGTFSTTFFVHGSQYWGGTWDVDTTVTVVADTWYVVRFYCTSIGTANVSVATTTAGLGSGVSHSLTDVRRGNIGWEVTSSNSTAKTLKIDAVFLKYDISR
jgi:hypothetical protein